MSFPSISRSFFLQILLLALAILLTRGIFLTKTYIHSDEALFALSAKIWQNGGIPYVDFFETKPLGVYLFYRLASWPSGTSPDISIQAIHWVSLLWTLGTALSLRALAKRVFTERTGWIAALFFVLFSSFWGPDIVAIHIEVVLLLPWCLSLYFLSVSPEKLRFGNVFLSGLFASLAFLCKYQAGILLPVYFLYFWMILKIVDPTHSWRRAFHFSCALSLGFALPLLVMLFYLDRVGAWREFYFWNFLGNISYIRDGVQVAKFGSTILAQWGRYLAATFLLWLLAARRLRYFLDHRKDLSRASLAREWLLWIWALLTLIPVSTGFRFEDHYFLFLTPALCVLAAAGLVDSPAPIRGKWLTACVLLFAIPALFFSGTRYFLEESQRVLQDDVMKDYSKYGDYLKSLTAPEDRVFVWGCAPSVYLSAERNPATRFLRTDNLAGRVAGVDAPISGNEDFRHFITPGAWDRFFEDINKHPPLYIMDTSPTGLHGFGPYPMSQYPEMLAFLKANYRFSGEYEKALVYRRIVSN